MDNSCSVRVGLLFVFVVNFIISRVLANDSGGTSEKEYCLVKTEQDFLIFPYIDNIVIFDICQKITSNNQDNFPDVVSGQYSSNGDKKFVFIDKLKEHVFDIVTTDNKTNNYHTPNSERKMTSIIYDGTDFYLITEKWKGSYIKYPFSSIDDNQLVYLNDSNNLRDGNLDCINFNKIILCVCFFNNDNNLKFHSYEITSEIKTLNTQEAVGITNEYSSSIYPYSSSSFKTAKIKRIGNEMFIACTSEESSGIFCNLGAIKDKTFVKLYPLHNIKFKVLNYSKDFSIRVLNKNTVVILREDSSTKSFYYTMLKVDENNSLSFISRETELKDNSNPFYPFFLDAYTIGKVIKKDQKFEVDILECKFCNTNPIKISFFPGTPGIISIPNDVGYEAENIYIKFKFQNSEDIKLFYVNGESQTTIENEKSYLYTSNIQYKYDKSSTTGEPSSTTGEFPITYHFGFSVTENAPVLYCNTISFTILTCEEGCAKCLKSGEGNCIECEGGKYFSGKEGDSTFKCVNETQEGYFYDKTIKKCHESCKTCTENEFKCNECATNYVKCIDIKECNDCCDDVSVKCCDDGSEKCLKNKCIANDLWVPKCYFDGTTYKKCHESCSMCSDTSHNCIQCNNTYFPKANDNGIVDNPGNCYKQEDTEVKGYFLDNNIFMECRFACESCTEKYTDEQIKSCECANKYYPLQDDPSQCRTGDIEHYFLSNNNEYVPCHESCLTCNGKGEKECTSCNEGYAHINTTSTSFNCFDINSLKEGYYYSKDENVFVQCDNCISCTFKPIEDEALFLICDECQGDNYMQIKHPSNCSTKENISSLGYYYDEDQSMYKKCDKACKECTGQGNTKCKENKCNGNDNYYPISTILTTCYTKDEGKISGYILFDNDKFEPCHQACATCTELGTDKDDLDTKCETCADGYVKLKDNDTVCLNKENPPSGYVLTKDGENDIFEHVYCKEGCGSCKDDDPRDCITCSNNYYKIELDNDNTKLVCINEEQKISTYPNYYLSSSNIYKKCDISCATCETTSNNCLTCNTNDHYYQVIQNENTNNNNNNNNNIICKNNSILNEGYYLDSVQHYYKKCYTSCSRCKGPGDNINHNCIECKDEYITHPYNATQCISQCPYYYYINPNNINELNCTNRTCPTKHPFLIVSNNECVESCDNNVYYTINNNQCVQTCPEDTSADNATRTCIPLDLCKKTELQTALTASTYADSIDTLANEYMSTFSYTDKHVNILTHISGDYQIVIYKSKDCAKEFIIELSTMELECLPKDIPLTTLQMTQQRENGPDQLSYAFYNSDTFERIDMSICEGEKIEVDVSISNSGSNITQAIEFDKLGVDVYDINHPFFNDICFTYTAENGRDVPLSERKKHYYQDVTFCEEGCELKQINLQTENATCECDVQTDFVSELLDNPLTGEIIELLSNANFEVMKCYKGVFDIKNVSTNIGGWVITVLCIPQVVFVVLYIKNGLMGIRIYLLQFMGMNPPRKRMQANILTTLPNKINNDGSGGVNENDKKDENVQKQKISLMVINRNPDNEIFNESSTINEDTNSINCISKDGLHQRSSLSITPLEKIKPQKELIYDYNNTTTINNTNCDSTKKLKTNTKTYKEDDEVYNNTQQTHNNTKDNDNNNNNVKYNFDVFQQRRTLALETHKNEFSDSELNGLDLYDAVIFDKRTFCQIYWNQLRSKEGIINAFFDHDELELIPIKAICFFLSASLYFTLNALFYFEDVISAEYNHKGPITFGYIFTNEIDRIMYSMLIGSVIDLILPCLTDTKGRIKSLIRRENDNEKFRDESIRIVKVLKTKILIFLIFNTLLMCFCWYYLSSFCYCYPNTQINWLIGGFITWLFCLILPFIYCFLITLLRYLGLRYKMELMYKLSSCLSD